MRNNFPSHHTLAGQCWSVAFSFLPPPELQRLVVRAGFCRALRVELTRSLGAETFSLSLFSPRRSWCSDAPDLLHRPPCSPIWLETLSRAACRKICHASQWSSLLPWTPLEANTGISVRFPVAVELCLRRAVFKPQGSLWYVVFPLQGR